MHPLIVSGSITQGITNWHTKVVSSTITSLNVNLYWGNPSNSLRLKVYSPDGYTFGPYYDSFDGYTDGRINFYINNPNGVAKGTWTYEVYGDRVTGTEKLFPLNCDVRFDETFINCSPFFAISRSSCRCSPGRLFCRSPSAPEWDY